MPRVDAIGISSAGVYIDNRIMVASLFLKVPDEIFEKRVKNMYLDAAKEIGDGIPVVVANDGDVTALAGAMELNENSVLGIAMGTSEAGGYIDKQAALPAGSTSWRLCRWISILERQRMNGLRIGLRCEIPLSRRSCPACF